MVPYSLVRISNSKIIQELVTVGTPSQGVSFPYPLDPQGMYRIIVVNFVGDTRGTEWYSDINTVSQPGNVIEAMEGLFGTIN
jgi:hypothetical protein